MITNCSFRQVKRIKDFDAIKAGREEQKSNPKQRKSKTQEQRSIVATAVLATHVNNVQHMARYAGYVGRPTT